MSQEPDIRVTENKMGTQPVGRLLAGMAIPMMISMLVQALYNIVDSVFVSRLSENALTAVSLAFPLQNLMIAVATGTGVGVNAALSRNLGEKNFAEKPQIRLLDKGTEPGEKELEENPRSRSARLRSAEKL